MEFFAIISTVAENPQLAEAVRATYPDAHVEVGPQSWVVGDRGRTSQEVCAKLGIKTSTSPGTGTEDAFVVRFDSYYGFAPRNIWEWLSVKSKEP